MAKYNLENKKKIVSTYLSGQGEYDTMGKRYNIPPCIIQRWIAAYMKFDIEGLFRSRKTQLTLLILNYML